MKAALGKWVRSKKLRRVFDEIAGEDRLIDASEFQRALKIKRKYFAAKAFTLFDLDGSGRINQ